jgi:hypothetical protein
MSSIIWTEIEVGDHEVTFAGALGNERVPHSPGIWEVLDSEVIVSGATPDVVVASFFRGAGPT